MAKQEPLLIALIKLPFRYLAAVFKGTVGK